MLRSELTPLLTIICLSLSFLGRQAKALTCWTCENADSFEDCNAKGKFETCHAYQEACGTEVRNIGGPIPGAIKVFKFCKQQHACRNILNQNDKDAVEVTQCNPKFPNSVCRCCCKGDKCNVGDLQCLESDHETEERPDATSISPSIDTPLPCISVLSNPENGKVSCSDGNEVESVCKYSCDEGFYIEGSGVSICQSGGTAPTWTSPPPSCRSSRCFTLQLLAHGSIDCSDGDTYGSVCKFSCDDGYQLHGDDTAICQEDVPGSRYGEWSTSKQYCEINHCVREIATPINGSKYCTDGNNIHSVCEFQCASSFRLIGSRYITCQKGNFNRFPTWSGESPICEKMQCSFLPPKPSNGYMSCSNGRHINSVCKFSCFEGYQRNGEHQTVCTSDDSFKKFYGDGGMFWTNESPICEIKRCDDIEAPANGYVTCTDENSLHSTCNFACRNTFNLVGHTESTCILGKDGVPKWSEKSPECKKTACPNIEDLENGIVRCSDHFNVGSECKFACTAEHHQLYPPAATSIVCSEERVWKGVLPCCSRACPPFALMDFIIVLDSSSSIGKENWPTMLNFVVALIELFKVDVDFTNFGLIRYNNEVDVATKINLNDYPDDINILKDLVLKLPYDGTGTRTGHAMKYVNDYMLVRKAGDRDIAPNIVLIITDGRSQDDVDESAEVLRDRGVKTLAVGINPGNGKLDMEQLETIAGSKDYLFTADDGFGGLTTEFAQEISKKICGSPCKLRGR